MEQFHRCLKIVCWGFKFMALESLRYECRNELIVSLCQVPVPPNKSLAKGKSAAKPSSLNID